MILVKPKTGQLLQLTRQVHHWVEAGRRLKGFENMAAADTWQNMEKYLSFAIRERLNKSVTSLNNEGQRLLSLLKQTKGKQQINHLQQSLNIFQKKYLRTETTLDFYADAINTRTDKKTTDVLKSCDYMARLSMQSVLKSAGKELPLVLTYLDKGRGASILKADLLLWDGKTRSPVAAIKVVRHNLLRPTALIHEAGHQIAYMLNWNKELAKVLRHFIGLHSQDLGDQWANWSSEIAADAFAFGHTGFAAVAGLHDVLSGNNRSAFRFIPLDPHPISYLRVLLGIAFCKVSFGKGPWDEMEKSWKGRHVLKVIDPEIRKIVQNSIPLLPKIAKLCLKFKMKAFGGLSLYERLKIHQVNPKNLLKKAKYIDNTLKTLPFTGAKESLNFLALNGYQIATRPENTSFFLQRQQLWMEKTGQTHLHIT